MCLAAPSRIVVLADGMARVECFGEERDVSLLLLDEPVAVGDYVLVQAGGFAFERVEEGRAKDALALMRDLMSHGGDGDDIRAWGAA